MATTKTLLSRSGRLWFAVLTGPVLWGVQLYVNYQWEEVLACSPAATDPGQVLGIGVRTWILLVNTVTAAATLAALAVALHCYRRTRDEIARWMALAGIINSVLFLFLIVVGYAPAIMLRPCQLPL
jgi:Ca2+/Na+ antiporter